MHSAQAGTGPANTLAAAPRRIQAEHLQLVLVARRAARHSPQGLAQYAAMTGWLPLINACKCGQRKPTIFDGVAATTPACVPMWVGSIHKVFERTQRELGGREVRRIWGRGIRSLLADPIALRLEGKA